MIGQKIFIAYIISNLFILLFVFIYGLFISIWPLQFYIGIYVSIITILFGKLLTELAKQAR